MFGTLKKTLFMAAVAVGLLFATSTRVLAIEVVLFSESFDNVTEGFSGSDPRRFGIPTSASFDTDENWYGARFEEADGGPIDEDVGVQAFGGGGNTTQTGLVEDSAGLLFRIDASLYSSILLSFDWRTFSVSGSDRLRVGYFIGDITAGNTGFEDRQIDLRSADQGGIDGDFNWAQGWNELGSFSPSNNFSSEMFELGDAAGASEVWIAFWLDGGEEDFGKIDNIVVTGVQPVPVPAALWLFGSAVFTWFGMRRKSA